MIELALEQLELLVTITGLASFGLGYLAGALEYRTRRPAEDPT